MVCAMFDIDIEIVIVIVMSEHDGRRSEKIFSGAFIGFECNNRTDIRLQI